MELPHPFRLFQCYALHRFRPAQRPDRQLPCWPTLHLSLLYHLPQVVVDAFDPTLLASTCVTKILDFLTIKEQELHDISMPLQLEVGRKLRLLDSYSAAMI